QWLRLSLTAANLTAGEYGWSFRACCLFHDIAVSRGNQSFPVVHVTAYRYTLSFHSSKGVFFAQALARPDSVSGFIIRLRTAAACKTGSATQGCLHPRGTPV